VVKILRPNDVAELLGISAIQLRKPFYSRLRGLFRTNGGQRRFRDTQAFRSDLQAILCRRQQTEIRVAARRKRAVRRQCFDEAAWRAGDKIISWMRGQIAKRAGDLLPPDEASLLRQYCDVCDHCIDWVRVRYITARDFPPEVRNSRLQWSHHRYAQLLIKRRSPSGRAVPSGDSLKARAKLIDSSCARLWLKRAERNGWGPRRLRAEIYAEYGEDGVHSIRQNASASEGVTMFR
jgi:hypothetical protein